MSNPVVTIRENQLSATLIRSLIPHLPRFAEEEGDFYSVPREELINALCQQHPLERPIAENTIALLETLLDTLALLNSAYLQNGEWCFVSFPAQLMATSILTAIIDTESRLFAPNFWTTQGVSSDKRDQQRDLLGFVENSRNENHASQKAQPIRYCYVAWSIIKLDGKVLFYQREDTQKRHDTLEFVHKLQSLYVRQFSTDNEDAVKIEDTYKKGLHKEPQFLALGLRSLIRREAGIFKFVLEFTNA